MFRITDNFGLITMKRSYFVGITLLLVTILCIVGVNASPVYDPANGHYYEAVYSPGINFNGANTAAISAGGYLATITSEEENNFIYNLIKNDDKFWIDTGWGPYMGPWIGAYQLPSSEEPAGGWTWLTEESWIYSNWMDTAPDDCACCGCGPQSYINLIRLSNGVWDDATGSAGFPGYVVEWDTVENPPPEIQIINATMVSPDELGIGAIVTYPAECPADATTLFTFYGNVNGQVFRKSILVPKSGNPGGEWGRMASVDINGNVLPTTPLRIDLADQNIPRFTKNVKFVVNGIASYKDGGKSEPSVFRGNILLPVIVIHGVTTNWLESRIYPVVYSGLERSLVTNGYVPDDEGYKTLWKVTEITYSSQDDTEQDVAAKMTGYITQATDKTYAARVNLIGHSLGGLIGRFVTTEYEALRPDGPRVHKLIMIGTPNKGSAEFYKRTFAMNRSEATALLTTNTGQPNLRQWLSPTYSGSLFRKSGNTLTVIPNPDVTLSSNVLTNLFKKNGYDKPAPAGVIYYSIYNTKLPTLFSVNVTPTADKTWYVYKQPNKYGVGDRTVIAGSAITSYAISRPVSTNTGHGGLASDTQVIQQVLNCLQDK